MCFIESQLCDQTWSRIAGQSVGGDRFGQQQVVRARVRLNFSQALCSSQNHLHPPPSPLFLVTSSPLFSRLFCLSFLLCGMSSLSSMCEYLTEEAERENLDELMMAGSPMEGHRLTPTNTHIQTLLLIFSFSLLLLLHPPHPSALSSSKLTTNQ